jgi:biopolymer transport protein ExbD
MARDFKQTKKLESISDLNVTPLIDLAFALLIIFMITTPVIEQYNRIELPDQSTSEQQPKKQLEDKTITIDANGVYQWGEDDVTKERLEALLDEIAEAPPLDQPVVHIRGDKNLPYQKIIDVVDMLKSRNLTKLSLDGKGG